MHDQVGLQSTSPALIPVDQTFQHDSIANICTSKQSIIRYSSEASASVRRITNRFERRYLVDVWHNIVYVFSTPYARKYAMTKHTISLQSIGVAFICIAACMAIASFFELAAELFFLSSATPPPGQVSVGLFQTDFSGLVGTRFSELGWILVSLWAMAGLVVCYGAFRVGAAAKAGNSISADLVTSLNVLSRAFVFFLLVRSSVSLSIAYLARSANPDAGLSVQTTGALWFIFLSILCFYLSRILNVALCVSEENKRFV